MLVMSQTHYCSIDNLLAVGATPYSLLVLAGTGMPRITPRQAPGGRSTLLA